jgi:hypothetical protein
MSGEADAENINLELKGLADASPYPAPASNGTKPSFG